MGAPIRQQLFKLAVSRRSGDKAPIKTKFGNEKSTIHCMSSLAYTKFVVIGEGEWIYGSPNNKFCDL